MIFFYLQLKAHARIHSSNRKMYECPREGCSRVYTKVSYKIQLCTLAATGRFSNDDTTLQHKVAARTSVCTLEVEINLCPGYSACCCILILHCIVLSKSG